MAKTNLTFTKGTDGRYSCEFSISDATALHVDRKGYGQIGLYQRSDSSGNYAEVSTWDFENDFTVDTDLVASVYPKYIKVVSSTPVVTAYIVTI